MENNNQFVALFSGMAAKIRNDMQIFENDNKGRIIPDEKYWIGIINGIATEVDTYSKNGAGNATLDDLLDAYEGYVNRLKTLNAPSRIEDSSSVRKLLGFQLPAHSSTLPSRVQLLVENLNKQKSYLELKNQLSSPQNPRNIAGPSETGTMITERLTMVETTMGELQEKNRSLEKTVGEEKEKNRSLEMAAQKFFEGLCNAFINLAKEQNKKLEQFYLSGDIVVTGDRTLVDLGVFNLDQVIQVAQLYQEKDKNNRVISSSATSSSHTLFNSHPTATDYPEKYKRNRSTKTKDKMTHEELIDHDQAKLARITSPAVFALIIDMKECGNKLSESSQETINSLIHIILHEYNESSRWNELVVLVKAVGQKIDIKIDAQKFKQTITDELNRFGGYSRDCKCDKDAISDVLKQLYSREGGYYLSEPKIFFENTIQLR